jgi:hypothetical protein
VSLVIEGAGGSGAVGACHLGFSSSIELTEAPRLKSSGLMAVTPEVASSSLVGPANPFKSGTYTVEAAFRPTAVRREVFSPEPLGPEILEQIDNLIREPGR